MSRDTRELTDERIQQIANQGAWDDHSLEKVELARALMRSREALRAISVYDGAFPRSTIVGIAEDALKPANGG